MIKNEAESTLIRKQLTQLLFYGQNIQIFQHSMIGVARIKYDSIVFYPQTSSSTRMF